MNNPNAICLNAEKLNPAETRGTSRNRNKI